MADLTDENYGGESYTKPKHRRDRAERRERKLKHTAELADSPPSTIDHNSTNIDDNAATNEQFLSPDRAEREVPRKERRSRSKPKPEEVEIKVTDEDGTEGAVASSDSPAKAKLKKDRKSENSARKRQAKKNLREKRRSTGVVIMPHMESDDEENEDKKALKVHTQQNEQLVPANDEPAVDDISATARSKSSNKRIEQQVQNDSETIEKQHLVERIEDYESQIDDFKAKLDKANKELDQLRLDNQRLKDENSALLRVVNQLSTMKGK